MRSEFRARIVTEDGDIDDLTVFVFELTPLESGRRSIADWVYEHLMEFSDAYLSELGVQPEGNYETVLVGTIDGRYDHLDEWDEEIDIREFTTQKLPDNWFDS